MLHRTNEACQSHKEEKDAHTDDASHHLETGHQTEPLPPCCDADHQQTHHLQHRHTDKLYTELNKFQFSAYVFNSLINLYNSGKRISVIYLNSALSTKGASLCCSVMMSVWTFTKRIKQKIVHLVISLVH